MYIMTDRGWKLIGGPLTSKNSLEASVTPSMLANTARVNFAYDNLFKMEDGFDIRKHPKWGIETGVLASYSASRMQALGLAL